MKAQSSSSCSSSGCLLVIIIVVVFYVVGKLVTPNPLPPAPAAAPQEGVSRSARVSAVAQTAFTNDLEQNYTQLLSFVSETNTTQAAAKIEEFRRFGLGDYKDLASIAATNRQHQLLEAIRSTPAGDPKKQYDAYKELARHFPDNKEYAEKLESLRLVLVEKNRKERRASAMREQFKYDGSHEYLVEMTKKSLHDPASFEHVETKHWLEGEKLIVQMSYRAKNGFGALRLNSTKAEIDVDANTIKILE
jgi:hypothetical protein